MTADFEERARAVHERVVTSLFDLFDSMCEGAISVDRNARVVWINDKYRNLLGLSESAEVLGRDVEEVIPESLMRRVVETGRPILLDIMRFGDRHFVVCRLPLKDHAGTVTGAVGFVLYDRLDYLKPILSKFESLQAELSEIQRQLAVERRAKYGLSNFIGNSPEILEIKRQARRSAGRDSPVLLLGETGTGKEMLAHSIHAASARANKPFVAVNVTAIPETLLEAEFFGAVPGAYTGADRRPREGRFQLANGGTLFLDEIGDLPIHLQPKLLRAIEEQEIERIGSDKVSKVDIRIIAATSDDLAAKVRDGRFRPDLYYRLSVLPIRIPPLRERPSDVRELGEALLERICQQNGLLPRELDASAIEILSGHDWPGNVRELRNLLERACMLTDAGTLGREHFAEILPKRARGGGERAAIRPLAESIVRVERESIEAALKASGGKRAPAAKLLGISRSKLYQKIREHNLCDFQD